MESANPTFSRSIIGAWLLCLALLLGGCAQVQQRMGPLWPGSWFANKETVDSPALSNMETAVKLLQEGEEDRARELLESALRTNPDSRIARKLMNQIVSDPQAVLGSQYRRYTVKRGDSMSELAAEALGDPLMFYVLARYNEVRVPNRLQAGVELKLPVSAGQREIEVPEQPTSVEAVPSPVAVAHQRAEDALVLGHLQAAISALSAPELKPLPAATLELLGEVLRRQVRGALQHRNLALAEETLTLAQAERIERDVEWRWIDDLETALETHQLVARGDALLSRGDDLNALQHYRLAADLRGDDAALQQRVDTLAQRLSRQYHESALIQYRNQRLEEAIGNWQQALQADPDYEAARVYLTRARELQRRLETLRDQRDAS